MRRSRLLRILPLLPFVCVFLGAALNCLAITANHGLMPYVQDFGYSVLPAGTITDPRHITWFPGVHLAILCDWIQWYGESVCSIGDLLMDFGDWAATPALAAFAVLLISRED